MSKRTQPHQATAAPAVRLLTSQKPLDFTGLSDLYKLLVALETSGTPFAVGQAQQADDVISGVALEITASEQTLFNANVAVRNLLPPKDASTENALAWLRSAVWIDWEESTLSPAVVSALGGVKEPVLNALSYLESGFMKGLDAILRIAPAVEPVLFGTLYTFFSTLPEELKLAQGRFPHVVAFYKTILSKTNVVAALTKSKSIVSQLSLPKVTFELPPPKVNESVSITLDHHDRKVLPKPNERNILITSALPYVNNVPHLGNIIGCVLSADVFARFARLRGYNTLYVCGTDEYGTATETKALEEKISCQELCDKYHKIHDEVYKWFDVDFDFFGRTTTKEQTKITQDIFKKLDKNGFILEDSMTQLYCPQHNSFLADRFVEGICPYCNKDGARGDQCDSCGHLINAVELKEPKCKLDGATPVVRSSDHLFLELGKLQEKCEGWVEKSSSEGKWSSNGVTITNSWLKEGLKPRCITRDLKWGTTVPRPGYEHKVFYVWFDACIGYPSITANYTPQWEKWWKNPEHVQLYQFMGKDNVPFHTVVFPSSLIGTGEAWTMLHHISTTEYLQYEGTKFSKSKGVGVFGNNVMESGIPVEVWRYYLLSSRPETNDSQFLWAELIAANNNILLANFGNYINRVIKFLAAKYDSTVPTYKTTEAPEAALIADVNAFLSEYVQSLESVKIRAALKVVMDISARGNQYLQESKLDNTLFSSNRARCDNVLGLAINLCYLLAALIYPYMPTTCESVLKQLNLPQRTISDTWTGDDVLPGHRVGFAEYLFKKIDEARVEELRARYGGKESETSGAAAATAAQPEKVGKKDKGGAGKEKAKTGTPAPAEAPASKKKAKAAAATAGLNEVPEGVAKTPEMGEIETKIKAQGELVRKLKTEKASAEDVKKAVDELLALKTRLGDLVAQASK